jgi:hypothetical protein
MKYKIILSVIALLLGFVNVAWAQTEQPAAKPETSASAGITVEAEICTAVTDRQPTGTATNFEAGVGSLYCWCRVVGMKGEGSIKHIWMHEGKEVRTLELPVKTSSFRTWSQKNIAPSATGNWEVKIVDASGNELKTVSFTVGEKK